MIKAHRKSAIRMAVTVAAVCYRCGRSRKTEALPSRPEPAARQAQPAARQGERAEPTPGATTFRLLTFAAGRSGPRLGATVGNGEQDIVDVHNAVLYLLKSGATEAANDTRHTYRHAIAH